MRIFFSSLSFVVTVVIGAIAFAVTAIQFPGIMRQFIEIAQGLPRYLASLGISDAYMVWVDILLSGDKLVLLGFILAARIVLAVIIGALGLTDSGPSRVSFTQSRQLQVSAFDRWGANSGKK